MMDWFADCNLTDKQGKNAFDLCTCIEISLIMQQYNRNSLESVGIHSPIGEVTTYIVTDLGENDKSGNDKAGLPHRYTLISPVTEKNSVNGQLFPIFTWLENIKLEEYYEMLVDAGYDDIQVMVSQMNGPMPISDKNLIEIGLNKPGHRRYLLINLEQEAGLSKKLQPKKNFKENSSGLFHCCVLSQGTRGLFSPPNLIEWLDNLELSHLYGLFTEAGYDSYELLIDIQSSLHPLTNEDLETEVKVNNSKDRAKILFRLEQDTYNYYQEAENRISFDEPRKIVCESCYVF
jgi:SAM domain (Sterile alpha motif)